MKDGFHPLSPEQMTRLYGSSNQAEVPSVHDHMDFMLSYLAANDAEGEIPEPHVDKYPGWVRVLVLFIAVTLPWAILALVLLT